MALFTRKGQPREPSACWAAKRVSWPACATIHSSAMGSPARHVVQDQHPERGRDSAHALRPRVSVLPSPSATPSPQSLTSRHPERQRFDFASTQRSLSESMARAESEVDKLKNTVSTSRPYSSPRCVSDHARWSSSSFYDAHCITGYEDSP